MGKWSGLAKRDDDMRDDKRFPTDGQQITRIIYARDIIQSYIRGATFHQVTYYDNRAKFLQTIPSLLFEYEAAGHSEKGKWSSYLAARHRAMGETFKPPEGRSRKG